MQTVAESLQRMVSRLQQTLPEKVGGFKIGNPEATLRDASCIGVSFRTGLPVISMLTASLA